ncbi:MAG: helix-turn-helix domain-containing protein [Ruminococcaceae bacterium]|nr:helix-turn-helix domain-containing protein [Oscillospiraceae bacterium]
MPSVSLEGSVLAKMKQGNFFVVQNQIFNYKLSPISFFVYCYLCKCRNKKSGCYPSKHTIASACGIAVSSVSKAIKQLSDAGVIVITKNYRSGRQINNSYEITDLAVCEIDNPISHDGMCPVLHTDRSKQEE